jgi:hypothetical protein
MNKYKKGFAHVTFILIGVIVLIVAIGTAVALMNRNTESKGKTPITSNSVQQENSQNNNQENAANTLNQLTNWKKYADSHFSISYPSDYNFTFTLILGDANSISTKGSSDNSVRVTAEKQGGGCNLNLCGAPVQSKELFNGVAWDYLGLNSYGDVGGSWSFYAYRTIYKGYMYYVMFGKDLPENRLIMQTFKFGNSDLSKLKFLAPTLGDNWKRGIRHTISLNRPVAIWPEDVGAKLVLVRENGTVVGEIFMEVRGIMQYDSGILSTSLEYAYENSVGTHTQTKITSGRYKIRLVANDSTKNTLAESDLFTVQE